MTAPRRPSLLHRNMDDTLVTSTNNQQEAPEIGVAQILRSTPCHPSSRPSRMRSQNRTAGCWPRPGCS